MSTLIRDDGTQFVIQAYRELLTEEKKPLISQRVHLLADQHGKFVRLLKTRDGRYETVFSTEAGYLLGESVKHYFGQAQNLIFCEYLPQNDRILLVVIRAGRICLDVVIPAHKVAQKLMPFFSSETQTYQIITSGAVPLQQTPGKDIFVPPSEWVHSFETLEEPLLPRLPTIASLQLLPLTFALKAEHLYLKPTISQREDNKMKRNRKQMIALVFLFMAIIFLSWQVYPYFQKDPPNNATQKIDPPSLYQQKYNALMNKYKMAKMERQLLNEEVAIAAARQRIAKLNQQTQRLTEKFDPPASASSSKLKLVLDDKEKTIEVDPPAKIQQYTLDEILLLELPSSSYTIRIKGSYNKHELMTFAKNNSLDEDAIYYSHIRNHKKWYVLLYSYYNTKVDATDALKTLTEKVKNEHPAITRISSIQALIKAQKAQIET